MEKISQFRCIADFELIVKQLEEGCQECMSSPLLLTDSILGLNCYPNISVCLTIIINSLYASINSPLQVYETYLTDNIIYFCAIGGCKAVSLNQKICLYLKAVSKPVDVFSLIQKRLIIGTGFNH